MKKILLISAALTALLAGPALAQRDDNHDRGGGDRGGRAPAAAPHGVPGRPAGPAPQAAPPPPPAAPTPQAGRAAAGQERAQHDQAQRTQAQSNRGNNFGRADNRPEANRGNDNRGNNAGRADNRPGNNNANRRPNPSYSQYHRSFNATQRYHYRGPSYRRPSGWYARRWTFGDFLPSLFWSSSYWINDFGYYGLMAPPPGTVWIRDGDDAILIDRYTGEVIQVEYGLFY